MIHELETTVLKAFVTVSETRNFSTAARILRKTQPAISQQIKKLEDNVRKKLFFRGANTVELTADGEMLLRFAREIVNLSESARNFMSMQLPTTQINVGAPDDYLQGYLQRPLAILAEEYPDALISVTCENSRELVRKWELGELDICLVATAPGKGLGKTLIEDRLVWASSSDWKPVENTLPLSGFPKGCHVRDAMIKSLEAVRVPWRFVFSSNCINAIHNHVSAGLSISAFESTLLPDDVVDIGSGLRLPALPPIRIAILNNEKNGCDIQARLTELVLMQLD
jgi:DNA-binding transcriptional LysR family regulator